MIATTPEIERYRAQFETLAARREGREPGWLTAQRRLALDRFMELGFPTTRHEEWKYTDVRPIAQAAFSLAEAGSAPTTLMPEQEAIAEVAACRLVFVNGLFAPERSRLDRLPRGVKVLSLSAALETEPELVEAHLGRYARFDAHAFAALNSALWQDGALIHVRRGALIEEPIHLLFLATGGSAAHPRTLVVMEESSQAALIETYIGAGAGPGFTNAVTEVVCAQNAVLDHVKAELESEQAYHVAVTHVQMARDAQFTSQNISLGGLLVRNDIEGVLAGEGIEATFNGLYVANGRQHIDNHTLIDHAMPHGTSHEIYKGIMDDRATGVFNGKIMVRQDAQKTDSKQTNQNLLLSEQAVVDTKPQLMIFADDVRCTHGATVGQLDPGALFYLRSRGIGAAEARAMLTHAFASDILDRVKSEPLREALEARLLQRLRQ